MCIRDRPSFKQMIQDIEDGKVKTVIVKDMSRLGRDYLKVGYFSEIFFPDNDVRLIAINDGVDTVSYTHLLCGLQGSKIAK